jgi:hypothetical protein
VRGWRDQALPSAVALGAVLSFAIAGCASSSPSASSAESGPGSASPSPSPTASATADPAARAAQDATAAGRAYRRAFVVFAGLASRGGIDKPTAEMSRVATGQYLRYQVKELKGFRSRELRTSTRGVVRWVKVHAQAPNRVVLESCEDYRTVRILDSRGEAWTVHKGHTRVYRQLVAVDQDSGVWRPAEIATQEALRRC